MKNLKESVLYITSKYKLPIICAIFVFIFFHIYTIQSHIFIESDLSNMVLEADDFLKGNILLKGWYNDWFSTGITYLTTDFLYFLIAVKIFGICKTSVFLGCSLYAFMSILTAFLLVKDDIKKLTIANLVFFLCLCGLSYPFIKTLHVHCGSFVWSYIIFFLTAKYLETKNKKFFIPILILLTLSIFGDMITIPLAVLPIWIYSLCKMFHTKDFDTYLPLIIYTMATFIFACFGLKLYLNAAGIAYNYQPLTFMAIEDLLENILLVFKQIILVFGVGEFYKHRIVNPYTTYLSFIYMLILFVGVYLIYKNIKESLTNQKPDFISICLSYSVIIQILLLMLTTYNSDLFNARYIAFMPINCAIIILRRYNCFEMFPKKQYFIILSVLVLTFITSAFYAYHKYEKKISTDYLQEILEKQHLSNGINNEYWSSSSITVASKNKIKVRNIEVTQKGKIIPSTWFSKKEWYDEPVEFVAVNIKADNANLLKNLLKDKTKKRIDFMEYSLFILKDENRNSVNSQIY